MASYTMTLRECLQTILTLKRVDYDHLPTRDFIELGRTHLFDFDYPIFDSEYKAVIETNFIRNFYMREIGFETEDLFKFQLETWLLINMPYFNKMFESELITYDPLVNSEMENTHTKTNDKDELLNSTTDGTTNKTSNQTKDSTNSQTTDGSLTTDNFSRDLESDNPDSRLAITSNDGEGVIEYASKIKENNNNDSSTSTADSSGTSNDTINGTESDTTNVTGNSTNAVNETETYVQNRVGKIGVQSYQKMIMEYRESLVRIEKKMHEEMQQLFMLVY